MDKKHMSGGMETSYNDINLKDEKNKQAEEYLLQAWDVAGYHGLENEEIYPRTAKETRQMDELLTKAEAAVDDPSDKELMDALYETREVVDWSKQRHWTFSWWVIICVTIMGAYYFFQAGGKDDDVKRWQNIGDAEVQKMLDESIQQAEKSVAYYKEKLTCDTLSAENRKGYESDLKHANERLEEQKNYTIATYKEHLIGRAEGRASGTRWAGIWCFIWIGLYIFACRPRGYMITKRRREDQMATGLKKILFGFAGGLVGAAASMKVTETVTTWSDGTKTREDDSMMVNIMRFGFIAVAVLLILWAARIVIVIATLLALLRNYDWLQLLKDPKQMINELK